MTTTEGWMQVMYAGVDMRGEGLEPSREANVAWVAYFILHSVLASERAKSFADQRLGRLATYYRLTYNVIALVTVIPPLWLLMIQSGAPLVERPVWADWAADGVFESATVS